MRFADGAIPEDYPGDRSPLSPWPYPPISAASTSAHDQIWRSGRERRPDLRAWAYGRVHEE